MTKNMKIGSSEITLTISDDTVEKLRSNMIYRRFILPVRRFLGSQKNKANADGAKAYQVDEVKHNHEIIMAEGNPVQKAILDRISKIEWYHSIDLGHGVVTPGFYNHSPLLPFYHLPQDMKGMRVLDVATNDGFWAFEFEKRGAAEVIGIDVKSLNHVDLPPRIRAIASKETLDKEWGQGFNIASEILGSKVRKNILSVYDLSPEQFGKFDFVFCSDLLLHLINPMAALQRIHSVVSGYAMIADVFYPELGEDETDTLIQYLGAKIKCTWWRFSIGSLREMMLDAGFSKVELVSKFKFDIRGQEKKYWRAVFRAYP